jgi:hypothetical protein
MIRTNSDLHIELMHAHPDTWEPNGGVDWRNMDYDLEE